MKLNLIVKHEGEVVGRVITNRSLTLAEALELLSVDLSEEIEAQVPRWNPEKFEMVYEEEEVQYVALAPHSYHYCGYDNTDSQCSYGYTYIRKPDPADQIRYADRPVTHIELRPDVEVQTNDEDGAAVTWDPDLPCPFVYRPTTEGNDTDN